MLHLNPYWLVTRGVTVVFKFLTRDKDIQVNSSIQEIPNKLTISHNYTYIDNIDATSFKFNDTDSAETPIKLDTQIEEMANNNFGIKNHEEISPFVQALLDEEKQTNLYNNHSDSNIIDDDHVSNFRSKRSIEQHQRNDVGEKIVKLNLKKGDFLDLYNATITKQQGIQDFAARIEMPDSTSEQLSFIHLTNLTGQYEINVATGLRAVIPNNYLHLRLENSQENQPLLVFVDKYGNSFVNSTNNLSKVDLNQISKIQAPNKILHYPEDTIFDLKFNDHVGEIFDNSSKVADFPNTQITFKMFNNNDSDLQLFVKNEKKNYNHTAINPQIHVTKNSAYLFNNGDYLHDFDLKSEDIFSQIFLDNQFRIQGRVTCGNKLYDISQNHTILAANITMPDGKIIELPFVGIKSPENNKIEVFLTGNYNISIDSNFQNLKSTKYIGKDYLTFCSSNGHFISSASGYDNKFLGIRDRYLDDNAYENIKKHLSFIKEPSYIKNYPIGTKFQLETGKGKVKVFYNNAQLGELSNTLVYCKQKNTNPPTQFIHTLNLDSGKRTTADQVNTYFVLDKDKDIALKTYKIGDEDVDITSDYVGGKGYINKIWETYKPKPLGTNAISGSITKSSATPFTAESNTAKAPTVAASSFLSSASTTPTATAKIITTTSTPSNTKQPETTTIVSTIKQTPVTSSQPNTTSSHVTYSSTTEPSTTKPSITTAKIITTSTPSNTKQPETTTIVSTIKQTPVTLSQPDTTSSHVTYSSTTEPSTTKPSTTAKIITIASTMSSTKKPNSTLFTDVEYSKASTEIEVTPETVHSSTTVLPENSSISHNISTLDAADTNRTYNVDIENNENTNQNSNSWIAPAAAIVSTIAAAVACLLLYVNKKRSIIQVTVYHTASNLIESNEEACKYSHEKSSLLNKPQSPNNEASTVHRILELKTLSRENNNSRYDDCVQNNSKHTELAVEPKLLLSNEYNYNQTIVNIDGEAPIYENV